MRSAVLIADRFEKADARLIEIRDALRASDHEVISLALASTPEDQRDGETVYLRNRAMGALMLFSQLVIAGVIIGYFSRFLPLLMTITFWTLVISSVLFVSRFGAGVRAAVLSQLISWLARFETGKQRPAIVFCADEKARDLAEALAARHEARLISSIDEIAG